MKQNNLWFKRRRYGYGWVPSTWQGWLVIVLYLIIVVSAALAFLEAPTDTAQLEEAIFFLIFLLATVGLITISYARGPKPKWRWGSAPSDNPKEDF